MQVAFGVALEYYLGMGPEAVWQRIQHLASLLRTRLAAVPGVTVHDAGRALCGIVAFSKVGTAGVSLIFGQCICFPPAAFMWCHVPDIAMAAAIAGRCQRTGAATSAGHCCVCDRHRQHSHGF